MICYYSYIIFVHSCQYIFALQILKQIPIYRSGSNPISPHKKTKSSRPIGRLLFTWRRRRDLNPRAGYPTYSLSRGAPSPLGYFCMVKFILCHICRLYSSGNRPVKIIWRREWDSNPRCLATRRFSRPFRYDHFGISP